MRKILTLLLLFVVISFPSFAALAFDASSDGGIVNPGTSLTWSHTVTGLNPTIHIGCLDTGGGSSLISGVTYNGVSATLIQNVQVPSDRWISVWGLLSPTTGTHNIVVTASASTLIACEAVSYTGANQSSLTDNSIISTNNGQSTNNFTMTLTTIANNCWTLMFARPTGGNTPSAGTGTTMRVSTSNGFGFGDSNAALAAGSHSQSMTAGTVAWGGIMISIAPSVGTTKIRHKATIL